MSRPNILFVFTDQQRYSALGCSGNPVVQTPHIDAMAQRGVIGDSCISNHPLCSPYRAILLTGRYGFGNGVLDNEYALFPDQPTVARALGAAGYHTGYIGKMHLGDGPYPADKRHGFDYVATYNHQGDFYGAHYWENEKGPIPFPDWEPTGEADLATRFLHDHAHSHQDSPFCLFVGWQPPHWPYDRFPEQHDRYRPEDVDLPENVPEQMAAFARREIAQYYGNVTALDEQMGRLLATLDELGIAEETLVCFSSDHGDHLSSHGYGKPFDRWMHPSFRASKATPYEESVHVPLVMRGPGIEPGRRTDAMITAVDLMPTLLGFAGVAVPEGTHGQDLSAVVRGERESQTDAAYLMNMGPGWPYRGDWVGMWRGVRTARYTYARWHEDEYGPMLFDREQDPAEMRNLVSVPEYGSVVTEMEQRLQRFMRESGDPFETGPRDPKTGILQIGQSFANERWNTPPANW